MLILTGGGTGVESIILWVLCSLKLSKPWSGINDGSKSMKDETSAEIPLARTYLQVSFREDGK